MEGKRKGLEVEGFLRLGVLLCLLSICHAQDAVNQYVLIGSKFSYDCEQNTPPVKWRRLATSQDITDDKEMNYHQIVVNDRHAIFVIKNYTGVPKFEGFSCRILNLYVFPARPPLNVTVTPYPSATFTETKINDTSIFNTTQLTCWYDDEQPRPLPELVWSVSLLNGTSFNVSESSYDVPLSRDYNGNYTCILSNKAGTVQSTTQLTVQYLPDVMISSPGATSDGIVRQEDTIRLRCSTNAIPSAIQAAFYFTNYATNITTELKSFTLEAVSAPNSAWVEWNISSAQRNTHSGEYICSTTNTIGSSNNSISIAVVAPPSAPLNVNYSNVTSSSVQLLWQDPADNGNSTITGFYTNCTSLTGVAHTVLDFVLINNTMNLNMTNRTANSTASNETVTHAMNVTDLHPGKMYSCAVFAVNYAGNGTASTAVVVKLLEDKPCTPDLVVSDEEQEQVGILQVCLRWQVACSGGLDILNCSLTRSDGHNFTWNGTNALCVADGTDKTFCDTVNLNVSSAYTYTFSISNSEGTSTSGEISTLLGTVAPSTKTSTTLDSSSSGLSTGAIIGIAVAGGVALIIIILIIILLVRSSGKSNPTYDRPRYDSEPVGMRYSKASAPVSQKEVKYTSIDFDSTKEPQQPKKAKNQPTQYAHVDAQKTKMQIPDPMVNDGSTVV